MYTFMYQIMIDFTLISIKYTILSYSNHDITNRGGLLRRKCRQRWHTMFQIGDGNGFDVAPSLCMHVIKCVAAKHITTPPPFFKIKNKPTKKNNKKKATTAIKKKQLRNSAMQSKCFHFG